MWLINTTSPEQKRGVADYFAPANVSQATSGSGGILGGTAIGQDGDKQEGTMSFIEQMAPKSPDSQANDGQAQNPGEKGTAGTPSDSETDAQKQEQDLVPERGRIVAPVLAGHAGTGRIVEEHPRRPDATRACASS